MMPNIILELPVSKELKPNQPRFAQTLIHFSLVRTEAGTLSAWLGDLCCGSRLAVSSLFRQDDP